MTNLLYSTACMHNKFYVFVRTSIHHLDGNDYFNREIVPNNLQTVGKQLVENEQYFHWWAEGQIYLVNDKRQIQIVHQMHIGLYECWGQSISLYLRKITKCVLVCVMCVFAFTDHNKVCDCVQPVNLDISMQEKREELTPLTKCKLESHKTNILYIHRRRQN